MRKSRKEQLKETGLYHKYQRGHNRESILKTDTQKIKYMNCLCEKKDEEISEHVLWHSYCIMNNHPHEVGHAGWDMTIDNFREVGIGKLGDWMRNAHSQYGSWFNVKEGREGAVHSSRPKTQMIKSEADVIVAMLYGDANPVRVGIADHPSKYRWSSYRFYAYGETNEFTRYLDIPAAYLSLGSTPKSRQRRYRRLMTSYLRRNGLLTVLVRYKEHHQDDEGAEELDGYFSIKDAVMAELTAGRNEQIRFG